MLAVRFLDTCPFRHSSDMCFVQVFSSSISIIHSIYFQSVCWRAVLLRVVQLLYISAYFLNLVRLILFQCLLNRQLPSLLSGWLFSLLNWFYRRVHAWLLSPMRATLIWCDLMRQKHEFVTVSDGFEPALQLLVYEHGLKKIRAHPWSAHQTRSTSTFKQVSGGREIEAYHHLFSKVINKRLKLPCCFTR